MNRSQLTRVVLFIQSVTRQVGSLMTTVWSEILGTQTSSDTFLFLFLPRRFREDINEAEKRLGLFTAID
jgi:hypothetical protein